MMTPRQGALAFGVKYPPRGVSIGKLLIISSLRFPQAAKYSFEAGYGQNIIFKRVTVFSTSFSVCPYGEETANADSLRE
jgi:hypothetical protein